MRNYLPILQGFFSQSVCCETHRELWEPLTVDAQDLSEKGVYWEYSIVLNRETLYIGVLQLFYRKAPYATNCINPPAIRSLYTFSGEKNLKFWKNILNNYYMNIEPAIAFKHLIYNKINLYVDDGPSKL